MGKSYPRRLAKFFLLPAGLLLVVYLALPIWLPSLVRMQLPPAWTLETLEFDYPASWVLHLDKLVLNGNPGGIGVQVTARDLDINTRTRSAEATSVDVDIAVSGAGRKKDYFDLDDLAVPVFIGPGALPRIAVDSLRLNLQSGTMTGNSLLFTDLQLGGTETTQGWLNTSLPLPGMSDLDGRIETRLLHDSLEAKLQIRQRDGRKVLQIDFRQSAGDTRISSEVFVQADLRDLQSLLQATFPATGFVDKLKSVQGLVSIDGHFSGSDTQTLDRASLSTQEVIIDRGSESLSLDMDLELQRQEDRVLINFPGPGILRFNDSSNRLSGLLNKLQPITQSEAGSAKGINDSLQAVIGPHSEIRLQMDAPAGGAFRGALAADFSSALLDLVLDLGPDAHFRMAGLLTPQSLSGSGAVNIKLESSQALTFETMASASMPLGGSLQASGLLELEGHTVRFTDSTGLRVFSPRLTADFESGKLDFHDLEFSGLAEFELPVTSDEFAAEFRYDGSAQSSSARMSLSQPGQAPATMIDMEAMALQLDFLLSQDRWQTSGAGTLRNLRVDSSGISASEVALEWNRVDLQAMTGKFRSLTQGLVLSHEEETYQGVDLEVDYTLLSGGRIEGEGDLLLAGDIRAPIRFSGELEAKDWLIDILPSQLSLSQAAQALEAVIGTLPGQLSLAGGTIDIEGSLNLGATIQGKMAVNGTALGFSAGESTVEGADFSFDSVLTETAAGNGWITIQRIGLAAGLDLFDARVSVGLMKPDRLELDDLQATIFGGQLLVNQLRLSPEGLSDTQIKMTDIDLGQVLEYIDVGGLTGTGKLAITLPAGSRGSSLHVRNGTFRANGPGVLRYSKSLSAAPAGNIGLSALENFHFTELSGTIDYHSDGSYQLLIHLSGNNPDLYDGYPIALNLNIGGMLPEAFEVLFLTGDFDKAILNRIRQENVN